MKLKRLFTCRPVFWFIVMPLIMVTIYTLSYFMITAVDHLGNPKAWLLSHQGILFGARIMIIGVITLLWPYVLSLVNYFAKDSRADNHNNLLDSRWLIFGVLAGIELLMDMPVILTGGH